MRSWCKSFFWLIPFLVLKIKRNGSNQLKTNLTITSDRLLWEYFVVAGEFTGAPNDNFRKNICSEDDLRSRIFETFVVKFLACLPLLPPCSSTRHHISVVFPPPPPPPQTHFFCLLSITTSLLPPPSN